MWRQIVLMAFLVLAACSQTETVKIGVVAPLSGPLGFYGSDMVKGAEFALAEINADGGINGKHVELIFEDTECKPEPTQKALKKFKDLDGVVGYIGPFCGSPEEVAWSFSEEQKFLGITANNNYGKKSEWFFSVMPLVEYEDKMLAEHAFTQGLRKIGIMHQDNYFGEMHKDYFTQYFEELG
ncbi:MAG: ABC transporter substrate-binding protein, partial [Candidatus Nanoarchaeia archaeon]